MIMKKYYFLAMLFAAIVSCTSNDFIGDDNLQEANGQAAISFNMNTPAVTRAGGADAATALSNQFIVYAEKNESGGTAPATGNLVFQNYKVAYTASTAHTTTSNTNDWEYVGKSWTSDEQANITTSTTDEQTIKYWDFGATSYTFTAVSALPDDISSGRVKITKTTSGTNQYAKGYIITLAKSGTEPSYDYPNLSKLYVADRNYIAKGDGYTHNAVTMNFRNAQSHVRAGVYETIPGYKISEIKFFNQEATPVEYQVSSTRAFGAVCPNVSTSNFEGTITVAYGNATSGVENQPILTVTPTGSAGTDLVLGTNMSTLTVGSTEPAVTAKFLGEAANAPTYDTGGGNYTSVMPQESNTTNLKLKVNYTLYNEITKEAITITGKTAEIPGKYLAWKPNYKYTYLFKITDNDLNPITFDAAVIEAGDGTAEYITTVTEPSITTFAVVLDNTDKFKNYVTDKNDYQLPGGTDKLDIYATFMKGDDVLTPQLTGSTKDNYVTVYSVDYKDGTTDADKTTHPITELSVANAIAHTGGLITATAITGATNDYFATAPAQVGEVPGEDGVNKTIDALKLQGVKLAGKYAVEIITYKEVTGLTVGTSLVEDYYTLSSETYTKCDAEAKAAENTTYYKQVKTYKVITVVAAS